MSFDQRSQLKNKFISPRREYYLIYSCLFDSHEIIQLLSLIDSITLVLIKCLYDPRYFHIHLF